MKNSIKWLRTRLNKKKQKKNGFECIAPWMFVSSGSNGKTRVCCVSQNYSVKGSLYENELADIFNDNIFKETRKKFLAGEVPPGCETCHKHFLRNKKTVRDQFNEIDPKNFKLLEKTNSDGTVDYPPARLHLRLNNTCNLKCVTCHSTLSNTLMKENQQLIELNEKLPYDLKSNHQTAQTFKKHDDNIFMNSLKKSLPALESITISNGEPLIDNTSIRVLEMISQMKPTVETCVTTNLTHINEELLISLNRLMLNISVDGINDTYEYTRYPAKWTKFEENFKIVQKLKIDFKIFITPSPYNILNIGSIINYFVNKQVDPLNISFCIVNSPQCMQLRHMPISLKKEALMRIAPIERGLETLPAILDEIRKSGDEQMTAEFYRLSVLRDKYRNKKFSDLEIFRHYQKSIYTESFGNLEV